jgi:hypothetical protein
MLVDPETHLPVRSRNVTLDGRIMSETTIEYLPRTPENIALAEMPPAPDGYTPSAIVDDNCQ